MLGLKDIPGSIEVGQSQEATGTGDEIDWEDPTYKALCFIRKGKACKEKGEKAFAPIVVQETELVHHFVHVALREKHYNAKEQVV